MNLYETVRACKASEDASDPSCSKQALSDAFITEINESKSKSALAELKRGETLSVQTVSSLNDQEEKFFDEYQKQLVWSKPLKHDLDTLKETLGKMSPEDGINYVHKKIKENGALKAPASNYDNYGLVSERAPNVELQNLLPNYLANDNKTMANYYSSAMIHGAVEFYDSHRQYEAVRALSFELSPTYWSKDP
ncbi:MAG: hypothetical protein JSS86_25880 [Cyanobacteria bacterium SZAS LIN-2]|nr:hypothetical protein [Cyanobacteria bacterium SZAS LIN-2]